MVPADKNASSGLVYGSGGIPPFFSYHVKASRGQVALHAHSKLDSDFFFLAQRVTSNPTMAVHIAKKKEKRTAV